MGKREKQIRRLREDLTSLEGNTRARAGKLLGEMGVEPEMPPERSEGRALKNRAGEEEARERRPVSNADLFMRRARGATRRGTTQPARALRAIKL